MSAYVYRAFDCHGYLLYVGSTSNPVTRLRSHSHNNQRAMNTGHVSDSPWFTYIGEINVKRFDTLAQAREAEARVIFDEMPHFNIKGRSPAHPRPGPVQHGHREAFMAIGLHDCRLPDKVPAA